MSGITRPGSPLRTGRQRQAGEPVVAGQRDGHVPQAPGDLRGQRAVARVAWAGSHGVLLIGIVCWVRVRCWAAYRSAANVEASE
jgi:hypothetical protein